MEAFLQNFFYADSLPAFLTSIGSSWGIRMVCMCSLANFFNLILHIIIGSMLFIMMRKRPELRSDSFFIVLLLGVFFSGTSKFLDWTANMMTATGTQVFWSNTLDLYIEGFQLVGIAIILYGIITKLFYIHHAGISNTSTH